MYVLCIIQNCGLCNINVSFRDGDVICLIGDRVRVNVAGWVLGV